MKYTGCVIKEALKDEAFVNFLTVTKTEAKPLDGATLSQIKDATFLHLLIDEEFVPAVVEEISKSLKSGSWFANIENEYEKYAIFSNKFFKYVPKDLITRQKAIDYAKTLGIPEIQTANL